MPQNPSLSDQGTGVPVVLLHSSMSSKEQWYKLTQQLLPDYRVIAIDLYGYGQSEFPPSSDCFKLKDEADRVARLIQERLDEQPFHLIGHSYGGATALRYTFEHQQQLLSLGLYEPVAFHLLPQSDPGLEPIRSVFTRITEHLATGQASAAAADFIDFWSGEGTFSGISPDKQRLMERLIHKVALDFQALLNESLTATAYRAIERPVCLLRSQESPLPTRRVAEVLEQNLPQLEAHWVGGGHMAPITNADEVNPHWINFLKSHKA